MADPFYYNLGWLMPMDGANNSTVFTDYSLFKHQFIANGNAKLSTAQSKFRSASMYLDGSAAGSYISIANAGADDLAQKIDVRDDWSFDAWVRPDDFATQRTIFSSQNSGNNGATMYFNTSGNLVYAEIDVVLITHPTAAVAGTWNHVRVQRNRNQSTNKLDMWLNGVFVNTAATSNLNVSAQRWLIGSTYQSIGANATNKFKGYIAEARFYRNVAPCERATNFTPPGILDIGVLPPVPSLQGKVTRILTVPGIWEPQAKQLIVSDIKLRDMYWGGYGRVSGTTKVKGTPNYAVARRVRLHTEIDGRMVREQWSDPVSGAYSFDNIDETKKYTVITYDHEHNFRAVLADNLTPDLMP